MSLSLPAQMCLLGTTTDGRTALPDLPYLVAGAALAELAGRGRIRLDGSRVVVADPSPTGDPVLDEALATIGAARRRRSGWRWVGALRRRVLDAQGNALAGAGIISVDEVRVLGLLPLTRRRLLDARPREDVARRLRDAVAGVTPDPATRTLLSLLRCAYGAGRTAKAVFPGLDARTLRRRLREAADDHWTTAATARAVQVARSKAA